MGCARTAGLSRVVEKVQALVQIGPEAWGISANVWGQHASDEILWMVSGVGAGTEDAAVVNRVKVCVEATVSTAEVVGWWVEDYLSKYMVVGGIPEENWAASGWEGVRLDTPELA